MTELKKQILEIVERSKQIPDRRSEIRYCPDHPKYVERQLGCLFCHQECSDLLKVGKERIQVMRSYLVYIEELANQAEEEPRFEYKIDAPYTSDEEYAQLIGEHYRAVPGEELKAQPAQPLGLNLLIQITLSLWSVVALLILWRLWP